MEQEMKTLEQIELQIAELEEEKKQIKQAEINDILERCRKSNITMKELSEAYNQATEQKRSVYGVYEDNLGNRFEYKPKRGRLSDEIKERLNKSRLIRSFSKEEL